MMNTTMKKVFFLLIPALAVLLVAGYCMAEMDDYIILTEQNDTTPENISVKYLKGVECWNEIITYNLLTPDRYIAFPKHLLSPSRIPAKVTFVNGEAGLRRTDDTKEWISVITNMLVIDGDIIQTGPRSGVEIKQDDGSRVAIRSNTTMKITSLARTDANSRTVDIELEKGHIEAVIEKLATRDSRFQITTPTAVSLIRGTSFRIKVEDEGFSKIEVLDGKIDVIAEGKEISVNSNHATSVRAGEVPLKPQILLAPPAQLLEPSDHEVLKAEPQSVTLRWSATRGAEAYHITVSGDPDFNEIIEESSKVTDTSYTFRMPRYGTYFWRVSSLDKHGFEGKASNYHYFVYPLTRRY